MQKYAIRPMAVPTAARTPRAVILAASALLVGALIGVGNARAQDSSGTRAVPTYEAVGLYWSAPGSNESSGCNVQYRKSGTSAWSAALPLWFDPSSNECRGSIVGLTAGTSYDVQMGVGGSWVKATTFSTWSNSKPVARTVNVGSSSATLNVTEGGSASGYVVYDGGGSAVLDAQNGPEYNVTINASYVIVRGLSLKGARTHGILISKDVHDVVIEDNDISGWGRTRDGTYGADRDSGIRAICQNEELTRLTVQRNRIHDPRYPSNDWSTGHPGGPQGITISFCGGNSVYRWNEIYSNNGNKYNDPIGGEDNFSTTGFPNKDSDIYGNRISDGWDDGIEAEGGNMNVRIWGNYIDDTGTGIAATLTSIGPLYVFRNVWNTNRFYGDRSTDNDDRQPFMKFGSSPDFGNGRRYVFHNTMLQASGNGQYTLGGGYGMGGTGSGNINNTISMNNIWHMYKGNTATYQTGSGNTFQNDMFNGTYGTSVTNGLNTAPTYASGNGAVSGSGGQYALAAGTPGYDQGVRIPNFNDGFLGSAPDVGAGEAGASAMKFGLAAANNSGGTGTPTTPPPDTTTPTTGTNPAVRPTGLFGGGMSVAASTHDGFTTGTTTPVVAPTGGTGGTGGTGSSGGSGTGSVGVTAGFEASAYTSNVGDSLTFTVHLLGSGPAPTGTITFQSNSSTIPNCSGVLIVNSQATCYTTALASGSYSITGLYSGDSYYSIGLAGPITETVR